MNKFYSYYKAVIDEAEKNNPKLSAKYQEAETLIAQQAAMVSQGRVTSHDAGLFIEDYLITCYDLSVDDMRLTL